MVFRDLKNPNEPVEPVDEMHLSFKHHLLSWFLGFYLLCVCVFFVAISNPRNLTMVFKAPFDLHRRPWPRALSSFRKGHQVQYSSASMHPECRLSLARGFHHANRECRFLMLFFGQENKEIVILNMLKWQQQKKHWRLLEKPAINW